MIFVETPNFTEAISNLLSDDELDVYVKSHKEDLTKDEVKGLRRIVEQEYP